MVQETSGMEENIFAAIRAGYKTVARLAAHVKIREDKIAAFSAALPDGPPENTYDLDHHYIGEPEDTIAYALSVESINFGSGYLRDLVAEGWPLIEGSLYFTVATRLKNRFLTTGALTAPQLEAMYMENVAAIFELDLAKPYSRELADRFAESMRQLGRCVEKDYGGSFTNFVESAQGSAARLVAQLAQMPTFNDVHDYKGHTIPMMKRAQLAAAVLQVEYKRFGKTLFADIDSLTMFPDNGVPHVLHRDGILEYAPALKTKIESETLIPSGSEEEIEIRACGGHAVELIAAAKGMNASDIDFILWHKSVENPLYRETPTHRTLSRFY